MLSREVLYAAVKNNDARLDGKFFVGVKSTGIYCRPVCKARTPKEENCVFFETAAQAEEAGFRPCLLCRPELAPGVAPVDAGSALARRAARRIEEGREGEETLSALAQALATGGDLEAPEIALHAPWARQLQKQYTFTEVNTMDILRAEVGKVFAQVLEHAGVYKRTGEGQAAFLRFVESVQ